jgi:hypothetical protein
MRVIASPPFAIQAGNFIALSLVHAGHSGINIDYGISIHLIAGKRR